MQNIHTMEILVYYKIAYSNLGADPVVNLGGGDLKLSKILYNKNALKAKIIKIVRCIFFRSTFEFQSS